MAKFYLTTSLWYINAPPHIGHALEFVQADVTARFHRLVGDEVFLLTGTDEHGSKAYETAKKLGVTPKELATQNSKLFREVADKIKITYQYFVRTTDQKIHWPGVKLLWNKIKHSKDLYLGIYRGLYCIGCESFITEKELMGGKCPIHNRKPEVLEEKNYFFKLSKYSKQIKNLIATDTLQIIPESKKNEMLSIIDQGLDDISFSRDRKKLPWGIPVPDDPGQVIYVWGDALANYITAIGFGRDEKEFQKWWPADIHIVGKDILRFHAIYWPAMLISAKLNLPKKLFVHGFLTIDHQKISKSLGNVIDPIKLINKYGVDPLRYYLLREIPSSGDGDFSESRFRELYNGELANGIGNLISRVAKLCETSNLSFTPGNIREFSKEAKNALERFDFQEALSWIRQDVSSEDGWIDKRKPWNQKGKELEETLIHSVLGIKQIAYDLEPFLPDTAQKIKRQFTGPKIKVESTLFPRLL